MGSGPGGESFGWEDLSRGGSSFFPRGGFDPSSTSRVAASQFFFLAILRAAKRRADFFLSLSLRQSAIGTYCVGLDIL